MKTSVIIVSYNRPQYLPRAVQSILNQTCQDWEIVLIDNGSTNAELLNYIKTLESNPKIKIIRREENINNVARQWNDALDQCEGGYISTLDDDNTKHPQFIEHLSKYLDEHPEYGTVCCDSVFIDDNDKPISYPHKPDLQEWILKKYNILDSGAALFRRSMMDIVGYWDERMITSEDYQYVCRIFKHKIGYVNQLLAYHRQHPGNRMLTSAQLNNDAQERIIQNTDYNYIPKWKIIRPPIALTPSQNQVIRGIEQAMESFKFIEKTDGNSDLTLFLAPFQMTPDYIKEHRGMGKAVMICMEDPNAIRVNLINSLLVDYVITNDLSTVGMYKSYYKQNSKQEGNIYFMPILSVNEFNQPSTKWTGNKYDVIIVGCCYPSRKAFMQEYMRLGGSTEKWCVVGDYWDWIKSTDYKGEVFPILDEKLTMEKYHQSKVIVCLHRNDMDLGGYKIIQPQSLSRGYIEAYSGALVMMDRQRDLTSLKSSHYLSFDGAENLKNQLQSILNNYSNYGNLRKDAFEQSKNFTFTIRMRKAIHSILNYRADVRIE